MKKKLLLFLATTLTGLAIYSCTRDTDTPYPNVPDPDPLTNEALLRAKDFLDFEIGSPVLPNTYLRAGSDASQTRAADKQSYLYDAIKPDWDLARVWTSDSLTITEVPVQLTRPIRYTVLFENLEDTISYKTQAPYTRIVFNERKGPDTMYCFLVTFLPDESYIGNPALRSSNPSGSDYSGLTIYSHPDGTPAWGWRYDTGEITHTLPFDEAYRDQSDPDYRLRIDFSSEEYATRGLFDMNNLGEVLVPGNRPEKETKEKEDRDDKHWEIIEDDDTEEDPNINGPDSPSGYSPLPTIKMDDKSKEKIKPLLDKIKLDCLGQLLVSHANDKNISIRYDPNFEHGYSAFLTGSNEIVWKDLGDYDYIMYEELFHVYQIKSGGYDYENPGNMEIEAKVAAWKYKNRLGEGFRHDPNAWKMIGEYAKNQTPQNYEIAIEALWWMGYNNIKVDSTLSDLLPNYNKINSCND